MINHAFLHVRHVSSSGLPATIDVEVKSHYPNGCVVRSCGCQDWLFMRHSDTGWYTLNTAKITAFWNVTRVLHFYPEEKESTFLLFAMENFSLNYTASNTGRIHSS
jgi:hypothetical protein